MEYYKKYICVTVEELTRKDNGEAIMSYANYKKLARRKRIHIVHEGGGLGGYVRIDYNSLPERFRTPYEAKYGKAEDILKAQTITDTLLEDTVARTFYEEYLRADGTPLTDGQIDEFTINASVLNEIIKIENDREALKKALGGKAGTVKQSILNTLEKLRAYPGHTLPSSWIRIQQKIKEYKPNNYVVLVSGRVGNNNAIKITEEAGDQIVALKRSKVPQYNNEQLFKEFNRIAVLKGWKPLKSINTLVSFLNRPDIQPKWYDAVHGELAAKQRYTRKHKTEMPKVRDALWYGDGTKLNLYYKAFDEKGRLITCTTQVYEVMDVHSEVFLGYYISDTENYEAQYKAYRMAVETANCRPFEIVNDNQGGHKKLATAHFFERIARVSRPTAPYSPQSKTIESVFGRYQAQILHQDWRFTGQNITAKRRDSRPNLEFTEANKEHLYTLPELKAEYAKCRLEWNLGLHPETGRPRMEMYKESINPETQPLTARDMVDLFWTTTEKSSTFTSSGITITVDKKKYTYEVYNSENMPDLAFRRNNTYRQFFVKYDPLNMTSVRLYIEEKNKDLRFVAVAKPYVVIHRAIQEQKPGDMAFIQQMDDLTKQERINHQVDMAALEMAHGVAPEQHGLNRPKIKGITAKQLERFMDKSIKIEQPKVEPLSIGLVDKVISNFTYDQVSAFDKF